MDLGLQGRTALVMGASRGIGRAIAAALAREGCRVAIASRSRERLDEAAATIDPPPARFVADASDLERLAALPGEVEEALGPIDVLVANTGGPPFGGALDHDLEEWEDGLPLSGPGAEGPRRRRRPRDARAGLGTDRQRRLDLDPRADPRPQPLQRPPDGGGRLPQDARARGRRRRRHRQHRRHRPLRHRAPRRPERLAGRRRRGGQGAKSPPAASAGPRSTATSSPSSAPSAPPTSPGP